MSKFKALVDWRIAPVKERKSVGILDLAYELGVSPDYANFCDKNQVLKLESHRARFRPLCSVAQF